MNEEVTTSAAEQLARDQGWVSKEEWVDEGKEEDAWVDYKEFNFRGELMDRIKVQTRALKQRDRDIEDLKKSISSLGEHNKKLAKIEYEKASRDLRKEKAKALREEDDDAVAEIEGKLDELKEAKDELDVAPETKEEPEQYTVPDEILEWISAPGQTWYRDNKMLRNIADGIGAAYIEDNGINDPQAVIKHVEKEMKKRYPDELGVKRRPRGPAGGVDGGGPKGKGNNQHKYSFSDLSEEQQNIAKTLKDMDTMEIDEYVKQIEEMGELPVQKGEV